MNIEDLQTLRFDPSMELTTKNRETVKIDIQTVKRTGRKFTTRVANLHYHIDIPLKQFLKQCKDTFVCGGCIVKEVDGDTCEVKEIIQLQGHHRNNVKLLLLNNYDIIDTDIIERGV